MVAEMTRKDCSNCYFAMVDYQNIIGFGCHLDDVTFLENGGTIMVGETEYRLDDCPLWVRD